VGFIGFHGWMVFGMGVDTTGFDQDAASLGTGWITADFRRGTSRPAGQSVAANKFAGTGATAQVERNFSNETWVSDSNLSPNQEIAKGSFLSNWEGSFFLIARALY
jgi:hypothetical protein